jgi:predicted outer membrane repeat protein
MVRSSTTALTLHGNGHTLRSTCNGPTLLRQTSTGSVAIVGATLRDAMAVAKNYPNGGDAIDATRAAVTLDHDVFTDNNSWHGAVYVKSATVTNSTFDGNGASFNTDIGSAGAILATGDVSAQNSTFTGNDAYGDGAGIRTSGTVTATGSTFTGNLGKGGGVAITAANATITNSTFADNDAYASDLGGGAVGVRGTVSVTHASFTGNHGGLGNGGALGGHTVAVVDTTFSANTTDDGHGGAIFGDDVQVTRSTFSQNVAAGNGGAIHVDHSLVAVASTFDSNSTTSLGDSDTTGGAIAGASGASIAVVNSTLDGNSTIYGAQGSAIYADGPVRLQFDTITDNPTQPDPSFAPVSQIYGTSAATLNPVRGTVVSGGAPGRDCTIATTSGGSNYDDDGTCGFTGTGDVSHGADPQLEMLRNNGGPTRTRMPGAASPLVNVVVGTCLARDQRGVTRPRGPACDIGAVER